MLAHYLLMTRDRRSVKTATREIDHQSPWTISADGRAKLGLPVAINIDVGNVALMT
jgi:hypothetical protein